MTTSNELRRAVGGRAPAERRRDTSTGGAQRSPELAPLSYVQRQMWLHQLLAPDVPLYNEPITIHRHGSLDVAVLQRCLEEIVRRHECWRTTFQLIDGEPRQVIGPPHDVELQTIDLRRDRNREAEALRIATDHAKQRFDLTRGPLFRGLVVRLDDSEHRLYLTLHHMIFDGVSTYSVLLPELTSLYDAFSAGEQSPLADLPAQYADVARWQRREVDRIAVEELDYWRGQLAGAPAAIDLPTDHPRPRTQSFAGAMVPFRLPAEHMRGLRAVAGRERVTPFMLLLASFEVLLRRYGAQDDLVLGTVSGDRKRVEFERLLGCFLNPVVLRTDVSGNPPFREHLRRVREVVLDVLSHDLLPFELLVRELAPPRDPSRNPLYQVLFSVEPPMPTLAPGWDLTQLDLETGAAKFDLYLEVDARKDGLLGRFMFNTDLFERSTVERLARSWRTILEGIVDEPQRPIWQLPVIDAAERRHAAATAKLARGRQQASSASGLGRDAHSLAQRFEAVVRRRGSELAVRGTDGDWSYNDLNALANRAGRALVASLQPGSDRVALHLGHDGRMVAGILGVLKTGRAYVPLDPRQPQARAAAMLRHAQAAALLTSREHLDSAATLAAGELPVLVLDELGRTRDDGNLGREIPGSAIAYLLHTSGSTGSPKAVVQTHASVLHFVSVYARALELRESDRLTLLSSYGFDAAVVDIFSALLAGAMLYPIDVAEAGFSGLADTLDDEKITIYHSVPTVFRQLERALDHGRRFPSVRGVVLGGEEVLRSDFERFRRRFGADSAFVNLAGQAESSINSLGFSSPTEAGERERMSLGHPVADTELILLGPDGRPTELYGEIGVRSRYVALGYWREPERTKAAFLSDTTDDRRIYRSGDLARTLPDGRLEFAGRLDLQTKIAGARVEPEEIEAHLRRHPGVADCAVAVREDSLGESRLVAYLVGAEGRVSDEKLRAHLRTFLPAYMVPGVFVWLDRLPLTASNKVDRRRLPAPTPDRQPALPTPPRDDLERRLVAMWEDLLGRRPVGIADDFFALGGHSLLAVACSTASARVRVTRAAVDTARGRDGRAAGDLDPDARPRDHRELVMIHAGGAERPLFPVPGQGAHALPAALRARAGIGSAVVRAQGTRNDDGRDGAAWSRSHAGTWR